ncbi:branched-chain amino acid ABC transporter permease [Kribbella sp. NPDC056861]|uniref:branched-chain amino acid ABC transporter permease n=1 Tax=Kribbella sp. NPDC056861 TaxID=3154857 RepID=UPI00344748C1
MAALAVGLAYLVGTRLTTVPLNHPITKWRDRAPLLVAAGVALLVWAGARLAERDLSIVATIGVVVGGVVLGTAIAFLVARFTGGPERAQSLVKALVAIAAVTAVLLEIAWLAYKDLLAKVEWPSAKQRIPFPQIDVVTGKAIEIGGVTIQRAAVFTIVALAICSVLLWYFINRTRLGRGMQAVSQDPDTARLMGINVDRIIVVAFALGAALAAVAGISQGFQNSNIEFRMGFLAGLKAFTAAVLGGIGNIQGAVVGGLVLGVVESMATQYIPGQFGGGSWKDVWAFAILILVLVFRPQGLLGARVVDRA